MSKQKLIIIAGSPCVGKTTVTQKLFTSYENSAYFDGDWAWCVNPFSVDDPRLRNGDKTMSFALSTYLNSSFDYVFFSSVVVVDKTIREAILRDITAKDYSVIGITLTCSEQTLRERHKKRGDANECSFFWLHLKPYEGDYVINTDSKSVQQIVDEMKVIILAIAKLFPQVTGLVNIYKNGLRCSGKSPLFCIYCPFPVPEKRRFASA